MTKTELIQISKIVKILVEREVQNNMKPLLEEVKRMNSSIKNLLNERKNGKSTVQKSMPKYSINDILSEIAQPEYKSDSKSKNPFESNKNPIFNIFEDITPFNDESEEVESVLDLKTNSNDPASKILNKLQNTDFKKTLQIMEQSANRHNSSQLHR